GPARAAPALEAHPAERSVLEEDPREAEGRAHARGAADREGVGEPVAPHAVRRGRGAVGASNRRDADEQGQEERDQTHADLRSNRETRISKPCTATPRSGFVNDPVEGNPMP